MQESLRLDCKLICTHMDAFNQAIELVGGPSKMLAKLKERPGRERLKLGHLWHWRKPNVVVPAEYCADVVSAVGGAVTHEQLNPDVDWDLLRAQMCGVAQSDLVYRDDAAEAVAALDQGAAHG